jgi:hypothetical protein
MKTRSLALLLSLIPAALFAGNAPSATPSNSIPGGAQATTFVISKPGYYFLSGDRTMTDMSKNAIEIAASDVTLDLGGYTLRYSSVSGSGTGIHGLDVQNVEVRNGSVTDTPGAGIYLAASSIAGIDNLRVIDVRVSAVGHIGISVQGNSALVDRCTVDHTGNTGIASYWGSATVISNCAVSYTMNDGIDSRSEGSVVRNTTVSHAASIGIWSTGGTVADCQVFSCNQNKSAGASGIYLSSDFGSVKNCTVNSCYIMGIYVGNGRNMIEGNVIAGTLTAADVVGGSAIYSNSQVLAMNNRYSVGTSLSANVVNVNNWAF